MSDFRLIWFALTALCSLIPCSRAGIAAAKYTHLHHFKSHEDYDIFYDLACQIADISDLEFAELCQDLLVDFLTARDAETGKQSGKWFRTWWTGARGRYCLCHSQHGGSNNNMGMEVNWRDMKRISPESLSIGTFIASLMHFITELGKEHQAVLTKQGTPNGFIEEPIPSKHLWNRFQSMHVHTLSCCIAIRPTKEEQIKLFHGCAAEISDSGDSTTPLHLKIRRWQDSKQPEDPSYRSMDCILLKLVLIPRQHVLKAIDPEGSKTAEQMRDEIEQLARDFQKIVIRRALPQKMGIAEALRIYSDFHMVTPAPGWGDIPFACSCIDSHKNCVCEHAVLIASVYDSDIFVPDALIADSPSKRKKTRQGRGVAGSRRIRLRAAQEDKVVAESKIQYLSMQGAAGSSKQHSVPTADSVFEDGLSSTGKVCWSRDLGS